MEHIRHDLDSLLHYFELVGHGDLEFTLEHDAKVPGHVRVAQWVEHISDPSHDYHAKLSVLWNSGHIFEEFRDYTLDSFDLIQGVLNGTVTDESQLLPVIYNLTNLHDNAEIAFGALLSYTPMKSNETMAEILKGLDDALLPTFEEVPRKKSVTVDANGYELIEYHEYSYCYDPLHNNTELWSNASLLNEFAQLFLNISNPDNGFAHAAEEFVHEANPHHAPKAQTILFVFGTLLVGGLLKFLLKAILDRYGIGLPFTVIMMFLGFIFGVLLYVDRNIYGWNIVPALAELPEASPHVLLLVFLPVLIFESALSIEVHLFFKLITQILVLATIGLGICSSLTGLVVFQLFEEELKSQPPDIYGKEYSMDFVYAFFTGIISSATDPVAVVALLKEVGAAPVLSMFIEGESLFNDGTAIIGYNLIIGILNNPDNENIIVDTIISLLLVIVGSPLYGLFMGWIMVFILRNIYNLWEAELMTMICFPYIIFYTSDVYFRMSGVIAATITGIVMSDHHTSITPEVLELVHKTWEILGFCANTLLFSIIGVLLADVVLPDSSGESVITFGSIFKVVTLYLMSMVIRPFMFSIMRPFIWKYGYGPRAMTLQNIVVSSWGGLRGGVGIALALLASGDKGIRNTYGPAGADVILLNVSGIVLFTLAINASTMSWLLAKMGMSKVSHEKMLAINGAMKEITATREAALESLKRDRMLADADWERVEKETLILSPIVVDEEEALWGVNMNTRFQECTNCGTPQEIKPRAHEELEMREIARRRLLTALRESFARQFEEGLLTANGASSLSHYIDHVMDEYGAFLEPSHPLKHLAPTRWDKLRSALQTTDTNYKGSNKNFRAAQSKVKRPADDKWFRRFCYDLAHNTYFIIIMYIIVLYSVIDSIASFFIDPDIGRVDESRITDLDLYVYSSTLFFFLIFTFEFILKLIGFHWKGYWRNTWLNWNRLDFILLIFIFADVASNAIDLAYRLSEQGASMGSNETLSQLFNILRTFQLLRVLRTTRLLRFAKPIAPTLIKLIDKRINRHLSSGYDIGKAYVKAQEETIKLIPMILDYQPHIDYYNAYLNDARSEVSKSIGLLARTRPDISTAVKTRQSIRHILNLLRRRTFMLKEEGVIDDEELEKFEEIWSFKFKEILSFPHTLSVVSRRDMIKNLMWMRGQTEDVIDFVNNSLLEKTFSKNQEFCQSGAINNNIMIVLNGMVKVSYPENCQSNDAAVRFVDCIFHDIHESNEEFIPRGNGLNEMGCVFQIPHAQSLISAQKNTTILFLPRDQLVEVCHRSPKLERNLLEFIAISEALLILNSLPSHEMLSLDNLRDLLAYQHIRLVQPYTEVNGLEAYSMVFLVYGIAQDADKPEHVYEAPIALPSNVLRVTTLPPDLEAYEKVDEQLFKEGKRLDWTHYALFLYVSEEPEVLVGGLYDDAIDEPKQPPPKGFMERSLKKSAYRPPLGPRVSISRFAIASRQQSEHFRKMGTAEIQQSRTQIAGETITLNKVRQELRKESRMAIQVSKNKATSSANMSSASLRSRSFKNRSEASVKAENSETKTSAPPKQEAEESRFESAASHHDDKKI